MIPLLLLVAAGVRPAGPDSLTFVTARGSTRVAVVADGSGAPMVAAGAVTAALGGTLRVAGAWAELAVGRQKVRLLLGAPFYSAGNRLYPLAGAASLVRDSLFLPLQVVAEVLPRLDSLRWRWDPEALRLTEAGAAVPPDSTASVAAPEAVTSPSGGALPGGLRTRHVVAVDPGHGGVDPGNPGLFFPRGLKEKDVTLQIGLLLRDELRRRGIGVVMTRTTDTLIALGDRGGYCTDACDLFVSLHVNSLPRRPGYTSVRGFDTYFLAEAKTEDARRVAQMENDALRFEAPATETAAAGDLDFILKDLQLNEHLRESARLAGLIQGDLGEVRGGVDRGVKQAGFMVLTTARRPAVLVEMGYSTNPEDARILTTLQGQRALASAIADGVVAYLAEYERRSGAVGGGGR